MANTRKPKAAKVRDLPPKKAAGIKGGRASAQKLAANENLTLVHATR